MRPLPAAGIRARRRRSRPRSTATWRPPPPPPRRAGCVALVSPHAGLHYSGPVAAHSYALLRGRAAISVVLVGPSHRAAFDGIALHARGAWETPLGGVPIDEELAAALLAADPMLFDDPAPHACEHSLEMQLPFLQRVLPELRIVPVLMGSPVARRGRRAGARARDGRGGPRRCCWWPRATSRTTSRRTSRAGSTRRWSRTCRRLDSEALMRRLETRDNVACGGGPIVAVLKAARALGADRGAVLRYADSGDVGRARQDATSSATWRPRCWPRSERAAGALGGGAARAAGGRAGGDRRAPRRPRARAAAGDGRPRGAARCLREPAPPAGPGAARLRRAAAARGPARRDRRPHGGVGRDRGRALRAGDAGRARRAHDRGLGAVAALADPGRAGRAGAPRPDGAVAASAAGVLLPQVPVDHGWERDVFLAQTCRKAGLAGRRLADARHRRSRASRRRSSRTRTWTVRSARRRPPRPPGR